MKLKRLLFVITIFSTTFSYMDLNACHSDSNCSDGQVCCYVESWPDAQSCGGHFLCGVGGGHCCVNPGCVSGCDGDLKKKTIPSNNKENFNSKQKI